MSIKLALLKSGESVISDAKELIAEDKVCGYLFNKPHVVECNQPLVLTEENESPPSELQVTLSPWIILTSDKNIPIPRDWIITLVEPIETLKEMYEERVGTEDD
tara:strand:+ start:775 stop:1086 length:312 start_codon:yes stop_codon:yes gene_type:complete